MPDWTSPEELQKDDLAFRKFMHIMFGVYLWDLTLSIEFDWSFVTRQRKFRWPLVFYFAGRMALLASLIGIMVALDSLNELDCQALYTFNQLTGHAAAGFASINLSVQTSVVWGHNRILIAVLVLLILGHWSLILQGALLKAEWVPSVGCMITKTNNTIIAATFVYTMSFDLIVLVLNIYKLHNISHHTTAFWRRNSELATVIFQNGIIYFVIAFAANLLATIFIILNLNQIMSVIFNVPAVVISTIVSGYIVRRVSNYPIRKPEFFVTSAQTPRFASRAVTPASVHVHVEAFNHVDNSGLQKGQNPTSDIDVVHRGSDLSRPDTAETKTAV